MVKKILKGNSKLTINVIDQEKNNNYEDNENINKQNILNIKGRLNNSHKIYSFRFYHPDIEGLNKIMEIVGEINDRKSITFTDVVRGLIIIGKETNPKTLLKAIRKAQ